MYDSVWILDSHIMQVKYSMIYKKALILSVQPVRQCGRKLYIFLLLLDTPNIFYDLHHFVDLLKLDHCWNN